MDVQSRSANQLKPEEFPASPGAGDSPTPGVKDPGARHPAAQDSDPRPAAEELGAAEQAPTQPQQPQGAPGPGNAQQVLDSPSMEGTSEELAPVAPQ